MHTAFVQNPLLGSDSFMTKFRQQLSGASPYTAWLAAEMLYVMNLFPSARAIGGEAKRRMVREVWELSGNPLPDSELLAVLDSGIGHPGTAYLTRRDRELEYLIAVATDLKARPTEAGEVLADPWATARMLEQVPGGGRRLLRHILLNLLFPDVFEGIVSAAHRTHILNAFPDHLTDFQSAAGDSDLIVTDRAILHIRDRLESELGRTIDFYETDIRARWQPQNLPGPVVDIALPPQDDEPPIHAQRVAEVREDAT
ncbi:MAG TPA: hypothetical protein VFT45_12610, partial [Longimicrobium sp.]|nr:hypothetical protein [Longimicrobium sp.]